MKKKLLLLEQLQEIDNGIDRQKTDQHVHHAAIEQLQSTLAASQQALSEQQQLLAELRHEKAGLDAALHAEQENIRRSEANMKEIRTNKEFQAVGREITAARKQVSEIEDQLLQLVARIDDVQASLDSLQVECAAAADVSEQGAAEHLAAVAEIQAAIDSALEQRETIVKSLGSNLLRRYAQLREQRRGQALAEARDGSCSGCNMQLPPQLYNMLFKGEEMFFCPHCQRILLLKQEPPAA